MARTEVTVSESDLLDFIQANNQHVYDFCVYLMASETAAEDLTLSIFREFGKDYRRGHKKTAEESHPEGARLRLFQIAWQHVQNSLRNFALPSVGGRDTRLFKGLESDILSLSADRPALAGKKAEYRVSDRLACVDLELRVAVVLRDILKFNDEEVAKILGLRWGVYRHRLHRGRLDFKDALKGLPTGNSGEASA